MIKRTIHIGNPAHLSQRLKQMVVQIPEKEESTVPIEDIGVLVLEHYQISITHSLMAQLMENNCAVITSDERLMPAGLLLPLSGNQLQNERWRSQLEASEPLKKQLWQQTIKQKIRNQAECLALTGAPTANMQHWADEVQSGDAQNHEARAAAYYWGCFFEPHVLHFKRGRTEAPPNNLLNYGYAILRSVVARALVASGMLPTWGIHHQNRYNAYCLADDIMEPYRPYVDYLVLRMVSTTLNYTEITRELKIKLLQIPVLDVMIGGKQRPLMNAAQQTADSLQKCFEGSARKIEYPEFFISGDDDEEL